MVFGVQTFIFLIGLIWLLVLTYLYWKSTQRYTTLEGSENKSLPAILDHISQKLTLTKNQIDTLQQRCDKIERDELLHIQKVGLLRFNPFKDTGGDQSFIIALVDAKDTGVVISGLYSRSGTRWYAKKVSMGKGVDHDLSEEEKEALRLAKNTE
ncbi:MAG: DUF4446 family protein [Candidatus Levybacteria bacterium]|nr:DUF4446 family protein [Candidatus Levybacteria bacterium]